MEGPVLREELVVHVSARRVRDVGRLLDPAHHGGSSGNVGVQPGGDRGVDGRPDRRRLVRGGDGDRAALPHGGSRYGGSTVVPEARSRLVDASPVVDRGWDRTSDLFVVPSQGSRPAGVGSGPRRAETEMVAGRPVYVLYRPSRGLEVRDGGWDGQSR